MPTRRGRRAHSALTPRVGYRQDLFFFLGAVFSCSFSSPSGFCNESYLSALRFRLSWSHMPLRVLPRTREKIDTPRARDSHSSCSLSRMEYRQLVAFARARSYPGGQGAAALAVAPPTHARLSRRAAGRAATARGARRRTATRRTARSRTASRGRCTPSTGSCPGRASTCAAGTRSASTWWWRCPATPSPSTGTGCRRRVESYTQQRR